MLQTRALPLAAPLHIAPMFRRQVPHESEFRQLIERWSGYVRATLRKLDQRRSEADLEELEQDIRIKLWQQLSRERNWDKPASFIRSVVMSVAIDAARKRAVRIGEESQVGLEALDFSTTVDRSDEGSERQADLWALLKRVEADSPEKAQALGLHLQGFTTAEIGTLLGWTEAKARNTVYRLLEALQQ